MKDQTNISRKPSKADEIRIVSAYFEGMSMSELCGQFRVSNDTIRKLVRSSGREATPEERARYEEAQRAQGRIQARHKGKTPCFRVNVGTGQTPQYQCIEGKRNLDHRCPERLSDVLFRFLGAARSVRR